MSTQIKCPECGELKPKRADDLHDVVHLHMDWRKAARPERSTIDIPVGESPMCLACYHRIQEEFSPLAPRFDKRGHRMPAELALT